MPYSQLIKHEPKRQPLRRLARAIVRDYWILLREFQRPLLYFLLFTVGGGLVYGQLHHEAYPDEFVAPIDRPYVMLQLMILESPGDLSTPSEAHLIVFWYLMPVVFIYVAARGATDFVRLFFNRDERQDAWMEAIASTYRKHVIVFGAGHVGMRVIIELTQMGYDVVVIDDDPDDGVEETLQKLQVPLIIADGRTTQALEKSGLRRAISFVACTGNDHTNLEAIMKARDMSPGIRIVARMWDDQFANQIKQFMNVQTVMSSSNLAAPAFAGAALGIEITQTLRVGDVDYSMVRLTVMADSFLDGADVATLQHQEDMDIVLSGRGERVEVQPAGKQVLQAGDTVVIFARHTTILSIVARNRVSA